VPFELICIYRTIIILQYRVKKNKFKYNVELLLINTSKYITIIWKEKYYPTRYFNNIILWSLVASFELPTTESQQYAPRASVLVTTLGFMTSLKCFIRVKRRLKKYYYKTTNLWFFRENMANLPCCSCSTNTLIWVQIQVKKKMLAYNFKITVDSSIGRYSVYTKNMKSR